MEINWLAANIVECEESIYTANTGAKVPWDDLNDWGHGEYRRLAQAAIDAVTDR